MIFNYVDFRLILQLTSVALILAKGPIEIAEFFYLAAELWAEIMKGCIGLMQ